MTLQGPRNYFQEIEMRNSNQAQPWGVGAALAAFLCLFLPFPAQADLTIERLTGQLGTSGLSLGQKLAADLQGVVDKSDEIFTEVGTAVKPAQAGQFTDDEVKKFREALLAAWKKKIDPVLKKLVQGITDKRVELLDLTAESNPRFGSLSTSFKTQTKEISDKLGSTVDGFDLSAFDPRSTGASAKAKGLLSNLKDKLVNQFGESWGLASREILASFEASTVGDQIADAQKQIAKLITENENDALAELRKTTGFSRVVRCVFSESPSGLACSPGARISAAEVSEIVISNLPSGRRIAVTAYSADEIPPGFASPKEKTLRAKNHTFGCPLSKDGTDPQEALACDQVAYTADSVDQVVVALYKGRALLPQYGGIFGRTENAARRLRGPNLDLPAEGARKALEEAGEVNLGVRKGLAILVSGKAAQIYVQVKVEEDEDPEATPTIVSAEIPIGYERWGFETGGFFAISRLTDQVLVQEPVTETSDVKILRIDDADNYSQESGLFLNFIPRNYPLWGWGIGFSPDSSRPLSIYAGPTLRLRSFGQRAVANISAGMAMRSIKRFPGLTEGNNYPATSPLLAGRQEYQIKPYVLLQLGFSFGPIPGTHGGSEEKPAS